MKSRIYYTKPSITEKEVAYATDAARNGWGDRCYEYRTLRGSFQAICRRSSHGPYGFRYRAGLCGDPAVEYRGGGAATERKPWGSGKAVRNVTAMLELMRVL